MVIIEDWYGKISLSLISERCDLNRFFYNIFRVIIFIYTKLESYNIDIFIKKYIVKEIIKKIYINVYDIFIDVTENEIEDFAYYLKFVEPFIDNMYKIYSNKNIVNKHKKTRKYKIMSSIFG